MSKQGFKILGLLSPTFAKQVINSGHSKSLNRKKEYPVYIYINKLCPINTLTGYLEQITASYYTKHVIQLLII